MAEGCYVESFEREIELHLQSWLGSNFNILLQVLYIYFDYQDKLKGSGAF